MISPHIHNYNYMAVFVKVNHHFQSDFRICRHKQKHCIINVSMFNHNHHESFKVTESSLFVIRPRNSAPCIWAWLHLHSRQSLLHSTLLYSPTINRYLCFPFITRNTRQSGSEGHVRLHHMIVDLYHAHADTHMLTNSCSA